MIIMYEGVYWAVRRTALSIYWLKGEAAQGASLTLDMIIIIKNLQL